MIDTPIIDVHAHLGVNPRFYFPKWRWQDVLEHMGVCGVDILIQAHQSMMGADWECGEAETLAAYEASEGRILAYAPYNPNHPASAGRVERLLDRPHGVGIKIHPSFHGVYADDDMYEPAWRLAQERGVPVLTHSYDRRAASPSQKLSWVLLFERWTDRFPDVPLILGHAGGLAQGHREAVRLAKSHPNVYLDMAGDTVAYGFVEYGVGELGPERLLYGSDLTWIDSRAHLGRVIAADIGNTAKRQILGGNALELFGLGDLDVRSGSVTV